MWRLPTGLLLIALVTAAVLWTADGRAHHGQGHLRPGRSDRRRAGRDRQHGTARHHQEPTAAIGSSSPRRAPAVSQRRLSVHLLGFRPKSVPLVLKAEQQTIDVILAPQAVVLQQVVVTGEGIITTNEKLGSTVNTVAGDQLTNSNESNVVNALSAKAPNLHRPVVSRAIRARAPICRSAASSHSPATGSRSSSSMASRSTIRPTSTELYPGAGTRRAEPARRRESRGHRVGHDPEGRGRLGDLRRPRLTGRRAHHDQERQARRHALRPHARPTPPTTSTQGYPLQTTFGQSDPVQHARLLRRVA